MKSHNIAKQKADLLQKEALLLLPKDKENIQKPNPILSIKQWLIGQTQINMLQTDTVSSAFLLAQKWPFELLKGPRLLVYAFAAGNDTQSKGKSMNDTKAPKSLLNLMLLFRTKEKDQPYISMLAANSLINSLRTELLRDGCQMPLHIRWKHDVLLDNLKLGEISLKHAKAQGQFYTQLNVEVNVKNIPKNFGAYDFQPTYLEKHLKRDVNLSQLAQNVTNNLIRQIGDEQGIFQRRTKIKQAYQGQLIYLHQKVTIYDNKYEHIHYTGQFIGVNDEGDALLADFKKPFNDGVMKFNCQAKDYLSLYRGDY